MARQTVLENGVTQSDDVRVVGIHSRLPTVRHLMRY
jgi:hypothetical protein